MDDFNQDFNFENQQNNQYYQPDNQNIPQENQYYQPNNQNVAQDNQYYQQDGQYYQPGNPNDNQYYNQDWQDFPYYNYDNQEQKEADKLVKAYVICLIIPILFAGVGRFPMLIIEYLGGNFAFSGTLLSIISYIVNSVASVLALAKHAIAIIGKVKYPNNKTLSIIFTVDIVLFLIAVVAVIVFMFAFIKMCEDCG